MQALKYYKKIVFCLFLIQTLFQSHGLDVKFRIQLYEDENAPIEIVSTHHASYLQYVAENSDSLTIFLFCLCTVVKNWQFPSSSIIFKFTDTATATVLNLNNEDYLCFADTCKVSGTKVDFNKPLFNLKRCGLFGGVFLGETKFVLSNFLSNEDLSISYES